MTNLFARAFLVFAILVLSGAKNPAFADYLRTYVATTCDAKSGRGMVRFGYGDADGSPRFVEAPLAIDGGLSALPVTDFNMTEAVCSLTANREIKVRYDPNLDKWSVWVDRIRVAQGAEQSEFPFAVIVEKNAFRKCRFHLAEDENVYYLTPNVPPERSRRIPIECDETVSPITGPRDFIEYPLSNSRPRPLQGSMIVKHAADFGLCNSMIEKGDHKYTTLSNGNDRISPIRLGKEVREEQWEDLRDLHPGVRRYAVLQMLHLDLTNTGVARQVFRVHSLEFASTDAFYVVPPPNVSVEQATAELSTDHEFEEIPAIAQKNGWLVLGWDIPPYHDRPFQFSVIHASKTTYLLGMSNLEGTSLSNTVPTAVLWKGSPNGILKEVCVFELVRPHF